MSISFRSLCISIALLGSFMTAHGEVSSAWTADMKKATMGWDKFLRANVNAAGGVDYQKVVSGAGKKQLDDFLRAHAKFNPKSLSDDAKKALYINFYNAGMIANILRWAQENRVAIDGQAFLDQRVNDIRTKDGNIWNGNYKFSLGGKDVHLDDIEHGLIRGQIGGNQHLKPWTVTKLDPRIHAAVNCAALSCPRVREKAYTPESVDEMLEENMIEWLSDEHHFQKTSASVMRANQIVQWYYSDFNTYAKDALKLRGAGDYLVKFIPAKRKHARWMKEHFKKHFNDRALLALRLSTKFSFHYDWHIADSRTKK